MHTYMHLEESKFDHAHIGRLLKLKTSFNEYHAAYRAQSHAYIVYLFEYFEEISYNIGPCFCDTMGVYHLRIRK